MRGRHPKLIAITAATLLVGSVAAEDQHDGHAHDFASDIAAFHSVLAPLWHAGTGRERSRQICAQAVRLENQAMEIHSADSKQLLTTLDTLRTQCQTSPANVDAAFAQVHEAFHRLAEN
jgi:hypothetical protein